MPFPRSDSGPFFPLAAMPDRRLPWRGAAAGVLAAFLLLSGDAIAGKSHPSKLSPPRRGYPRLAVVESGFPPSDGAVVEAVYRNLGLADLIVFPGNRAKWWALPRDAKGFTLRDYNPRMKILQYLTVNIFSTSGPSENEITPPPTDPDAALAASTFSREEYFGIARGIGSLSFPLLAENHPQWDGAIYDTAYGDLYADQVYANWNSPAYRAYVKRAMAEVAAAGFDGMFFDFGAAGWLSFQNGHPTVLPPDCFRMKETGSWYWMSLPGERFEDLGPPPSLDSLRALDPAALAEIADIDFCAATSAPADIHSLEDAEAMILDFYADLRASSPLLLIWNGAQEGMSRRTDVVLTHTDGGHKEGFALRDWTPSEMRQELDLAESFSAKAKIFVAWNRAEALDSEGLLYGYAACMIAGGPLTFCEFLDEIPEVAAIRADPGKPKGHYVTLPAGETDLDRIVYRRVWSRATMYLNPTSSTITVDKRTLAPKSALILTK